MEDRDVWQNYIYHFFMLGSCKEEGFWLADAGFLELGRQAVLAGRRCIVAAVRRIVVGVDGSLGSLQALRYAADEARERCVPLVPVIAWVPPGGDSAERGRARSYLRRFWQEEACRKLREAFDTGLGGVPGDVRVVPQVERGETGRVLVEVASSADDLLVIGTGRRGRMSRLLRRPVGRYVLAHAKCPVLTVPPSALMEEMSGGLRGWRARRRANSIDAHLQALRPQAL
jgi:nucleotide-binding universal stress UspA family protein